MKKKIKVKIKEETAVNSAGSGAIAGIGVGPKGEPGLSQKNRKKLIWRRRPPIL